MEIQRGIPTSFSSKSHRSKIKYLHTQRKLSHDDMVSTAKDSLLQLQQQPRNKKQKNNAKDQERQRIQEQSDLYKNVNAVRTDLGARYIRYVRLLPVKTQIQLFSDEAVAEIESHSLLLGIDSRVLQ